MNTYAVGRRRASLSSGIGHLVAIECGAGTAIPTVRLTCEDLVDRYGGTLIRINPGEPEVPRGHLALELGALDALERIERVDGFAVTLSQVGGGDSTETETYN